jgi:hypothetical protein
MAKGGFERAEEWFSAAVAAEPLYANAHVGLAMVHDMRFTFTTDKAELRRPRSTRSGRWRRPRRTRGTRVAGVFPVAAGELARARSL